MYFHFIKKIVDNKKKTIKGFIDDMNSSRRSEFKQDSQTIQRKIMQESTSESSDSTQVDNKKSKNHVKLKKNLSMQSSLNSTSKLEDPMMSCWMAEVEEPTSIRNSFKSHESSTVVSPTPIESCFNCPKDTPSLVDESVHSTVIGSDDLTKKERNRKEFYYTVKAKVEKAVNEHKIFLIRGELPMLIKALEDRGWIQKYESVKTRMKPYNSTVNTNEISFDDIKLDDYDFNEKTLIYSFLSKIPPDFIWDCRNDFVEWDLSIENHVFLNRFQRPSVYTSKLGMAQVLEDAKWHYEENVSSVIFPRSYNPSRDVKDFLDDFRRTAAVGLLKWFLNSFREADVKHRNLPISVSCLEFAVKRCEEYLDDDDDIQDNVDETDINKVTEDEWKIFLENYSQAVHHGSDSVNDEENKQARLEKCYLSTCKILEKMQNIDPQYEINGTKNIWILKPSNLCCGNGIIMSHCIDDILRRVNAKPKNYYAVQKYIEKPLLIRGTKFDIRVWYLVTCTFPLTIWIFEEALLRFSSQTYNISSYHEAIHLCNTAIQQKYDYEKRRRRRRGYTDETTESIRDQGWDCTMLNEYLKNIGYEGEPYYDEVYQKMTESIILMMLASQEHMDRRKYTFELYGADFMVMDDLSVWLIEINTNPRMHPPSSKITQRLYDNVLESLVKVLMDLPNNPNADTGGFRQVYKQHVSDFEPYLGPGLIVMGKRMTLHEHQTDDNENTSKINICSTSTRQNRAQTAPPTIARRLRDSKIVDFVDCLDDCRITKL
ncbi:tubulin glycylase 3A-like isoform X1 [Aphidius gifuensis]|uniref:tubulin glycylase 3A-like isoform X1 n=1 Tax=Aphidius gifuensis TaxID=684658 RepID=UPI001CDC3626|nr:tubulin glycylase 3A-like isoform X1 [Aphidius gifuensis]